MAGKTAATTDEPVEKRKPTVVRKFEAPDVIAAEFGVTSQADYHIEGLVASENIPSLLDAFGIAEVKSMAFPLQRIRAKHGEVWRMRIDPTAVHMVEGKPVTLHRWVFNREKPELTAGANN